MNGGHLPLQRYKLFVEYIGTMFQGSQRQAGLLTVQGSLDTALVKLFPSSPSPPLSVISSRTDKGVHAIRNSFHVDIGRVHRKTGVILPPLEPTTMRRALNHYLRNLPLTVHTIEPVSSSFHSRFSATGRTYVYRLAANKAMDEQSARDTGLSSDSLRRCLGLVDRNRLHWKSAINSMEELCPILEKASLEPGHNIASVLLRDRAWCVRGPLDVLSMQNAADVLIGTHDWTSFRGPSCASASPVKTVRVITVTDHNSLASGDTLGMKCQQVDVVVEAKSFLYHQVRHIVGLLKLVGQGHLPWQDARTVLSAASFDISPPLAPAHGLYLLNVSYDNPTINK